MMVAKRLLGSWDLSLSPDSIKSLCYFPNIHRGIYTRCTKLLLTSNQYTEVVKITG